MVISQKKQKNRKPKWKRRPDKRPVEISEAALEIFARRGFESTTMDEIASESGVSKGTIYLYFPSKEDLLVASIEHRIRENQSKVLPLLQLGISPAGSKLTSDAVKSILTETVGRIFSILSKPETKQAIQIVMAERSRLARLRKKQAELAGLAVNALSGFLSRAHSDGAVHCPNPYVIAKVLIGINITMVTADEFLNTGKSGEVKPDDRDAVLEFTFRGLGLL